MAVEKPSFRPAASDAERLALALHHAGLGDWSWDSKTDVVEVSARLAEIFGIPHAPMTWAQLREILHEDDRERARRAVEDALRDHTDYDIEYRVTHADRPVTWVAAKGRGTYDQRGEVVGMIGVVQDITARKAAEALAAEEAASLVELYRVASVLSSKLELQEVVQAATDAATSLTKAKFGAFFYNTINERSESLSLYTLSGIPREAFANFPMPRNTQVFGPTFRGEGVVRSDDITTDPRYGQNTPHKGMPSGHFPVRSYLAVPVVSRSGEVMGGMFFGHPEPGVFTEQAARVATAIAAQAAIGIDNARLYNALRQSERRLRYTLEATQVGTWEMDLITGKTQSSSTHDVIFGYETPRDDWSYETFLEHIVPEQRPAVDAKVQAAKGEGGELAFECQIVRADGAMRWIAVRGSVHDVPASDADVAADERTPLRIAGLVTDITDRKEIEHRLNRLLDAERTARGEAERISRMKDEFLATVSHELRTPLNAIVGWTQLLRYRGNDPAMVGKGIEVIDRNARIQARLIEDLLDMSRIISGRIRLDVQRVELPTVIEAAIESVRPAAESKGVKLRQILDPHASPVTGDPSRLQQIIWNLLSNAIKFTPADGKVEVLLERVNSHVEITVTDTGQGIRPEFLPHLFERFQQEDSSTTRRHGGLGIGLAIVKNLVEMHGGGVRAKSAGEDQGATFIVMLPVRITQHDEISADPSRRHPANAPLMPSAREECEQVDLKDVRVLVVDDEPDSRELAKRVLGDCGAIVQTAGSANEAERLIADDDVDVILSDIGMPDRDGFDFIRAVRSAGVATPAAALTAFTRAEDRLRALHAGYQIHLAKPVEPAEMIAVVASLAGRIKPKN